MVYPYCRLFINKEEQIIILNIDYLKNTMLCKRSQTQNTTYYMTAFIKISRRGKFKEIES
jgi:hypothetical protein